MLIRVAHATVLAAAIGAGACTDPAPAPVAIVPLRQTDPVPHDADDPAVWVNPQNPARSLIVGTNKVAAPDGGLYVFDLSGRFLTAVRGLDRPNNVDIEYGLQTRGGRVDIAVTTERLQHRLRVFRISEQGLDPIDGGYGIPVLAGEQGERAEPMGIALYRRPADDAFFAIIAPKNGGATGYLWQYRLTVDPATHLVRGSLVRRFGRYSGTAEIEAVAVDDAAGYVYYSDELYGVRKWHADPDHPDADTEQAVLGADGFKRQREGIAVVPTGARDGFVVVSDQIEGGSELRIFRRTPDASGHAVVAVVATQADSTDGLEVVPSGLPGDFTGGLLVMMNSRGRNFQLYRWADVVKQLGR